MTTKCISDASLDPALKKPIKSITEKSGEMWIWAVCFICDRTDASVLRMTTVLGCTEGIYS